MKNLFVGNMSFQTTEAELSELFKPYGQVTRVHLVMDRETGRARGFAFVEMPNDDEAAKAIAALDGKELGGRNLKINEARPKAAGGGGGPRSGGGARGAGPALLPTSLGGFRRFGGGRHGQALRIQPLARIAWHQRAGDRSGPRFDRSNLRVAAGE